MKRVSICFYNGLLVSALVFSGARQALADSSVNAFLLEGATGLPGTAPIVDARLAGANIWLEDAEVRISVDDADDRKSTYQLRLQPKNSRQIDSEKKILELHAQRRNLSHDARLNDALRDRYLVLLGMIRDQGKIEALQQQIRLVRSQAGFLKKQVHSEDFRPARLQKAIVEEKQLALLLANRKSALRQQLQAFGLNEEALASVKWVTPEEMQSVAGQYSAQQGATHPELSKSLLKLKMAQQERDRARARKAFGVSLLQLEYAHDQKDSMSVGMGFRIPLGDKSFDDAERRFNIAEIQDEIHHNTAAFESARRRRQAAMQALKHQLGAQRAMLAEISAREKSNSKLPVADLVLDLKQQKQQIQAKTRDLEMQLMEQYIHFLHESGLLAQQPLRNWLAGQQPVL